MVKGTKARLKNNKDQGKFESVKHHSALRQIANKKIIFLGLEECMSIYFGLIYPNPFTTKTYKPPTI